MVHIDQYLIKKHIVDALLNLWIYDVLGSIPDANISNRREIFSALSELADEYLGLATDTRNEELNDIAITLSGVVSLDADEVENILVNILNRLAPDFEGILSHEKLVALEKLIPPTLRNIRQTPSFDHSLVALRLLSDISKIAARISFSEGIELSENLDKLVRDFEHSDEENVIKAIYEEIQDGTYLLS